MEEYTTTYYDLVSDSHLCCAFEALVDGRRRNAIENLAVLSRIVANT